ncbi:glycoside hydrolase family 88 protein [Paenibacillus sp. JCM 10914]|nr:glycosyl hydrolase, family 88 [Paenibacillus sp. JCM 10914]
MNTLDAAVSQVWEQIQRKTNQMRSVIGAKSPHVAGEDGRYDDMRIDWWTSGFWPGILWIVYDMTQDEDYKHAAWPWDERLSKHFLESNGFDHDVGFQFLPTAVIKYKLTGDADALRRGLSAANYLAGRFNAAGNFIRAWNGDKYGWSIIDTMMNLSLLFWASEVSGDPRFAHIARRHADMVVKEFVQGDGAVHHILRFDPLTGERVEALGGQGAAPDSAWSRGAAWAIYGLANTYRYTKDAAYLEAAERVVSFFLAHLPEDHVPLWDFRAPDETGGIPRDSSAGAIAASGLLELADLVHTDSGVQYKAAAERILMSLYNQYGTWDRSGHEAILLQATGHKPAGQNVNVSLIYGDYFFVEAIAKWKGWKHRVF